MDKINPILKKVFIAAVVIYIIGNSVLLSQLCYKVGKIEHLLDHITGEHSGSYPG